MAPARPLLAALLLLACATGLAADSQLWCSANSHLVAVGAFKAAGTSGLRLCCGPKQVLPRAEALGQRPASGEVAHTRTSTPLLTCSALGQFSPLTAAHLRRQGRQQQSR